MSLLDTLSLLSPARLFGGANCVGVDIGSSGVKVSLCAGKSIPFQFTKCLLQENGTALNDGHFKLHVNRAGLSSKKAAFSLTDEKTESHEFKLPKLKSKELHTAIEWEVKKTVTSPEFAYHEIIPVETDIGFNVQCVVASKDIVVSRFEEGVQLGFNPTFLETESSALLAAANLMKAGQALNKAVIIDLGFSAFRLIFIHRNQVSFTRSLYLGLGPIAEAISAVSPSAGVNMVEFYKKLKLTNGDEMPDPGSVEDPILTLVERSMQESLYTLCEEFHRSEFYAKEQKGLDEVEEVFLCGGGACIPYTVDYLGRHLADKKIKVMDPFKWTKKIPAGVDPSAGPLWTCAVGLSLRSA